MSAKCQKRTFGTRLEFAPYGYGKTYKRSLRHSNRHRLIPSSSEFGNRRIRSVNLVPFQGSRPGVRIAPGIQWAQLVFLGMHPYISSSARTVYRIRRTEMPKAPLIPSTPEELQKALAGTGQRPIEHWPARCQFIIAATLISILEELKKPK